MELAKLAAAKAETGSAQQQISPDNLHASPDLPLRKILAASTPLNTAHASFSSLDTLRTRQKTSSTLPNQYIFPSNGTLEYNWLSMSEFVSGYLEFFKTHPELPRSSLLSHLQLLMGKASTYSWASVHNFHLSVHNPIQSKHVMVWRHN